jgi:ferredoxin
MRVSVDQDVCVGSGLCEASCPEVFEVAMTSQVVISDPPAELHERVRVAAAECPTEAIIVQG